MSTGRIIAIVLGVFALLGVLVVGAGYYWFQTHGAELKAQGQAILAEAAEFAKSTDNRGCLEESLRRYDRCQDGLACHVMNNVFLGHCLSESTPTPGFCDGVPRADSLMESVSWRLKQCEEHGRTGTYCGNFFGQIQEYCDSLSPEPDGRTHR